jgi:Uncharacterized conserved protein
MLTITDVAKQETTLQFNHFTNDDAWVLGNQLVARAQAKKAAVTIDITRCHQQLFPCCATWHRHRQRSVVTA